MSDSNTNMEIPAGFKMTELGPLPEEWKVVRLGEVAKKMKAGGTPKTNVPEYWGNEIPLVKVEDVVNANKFLTHTNLAITNAAMSGAPKGHPSPLPCSPRAERGGTRQLPLIAAFSPSEARG
ncbi:MAG: restriction endonuclease subunit S, partial [bacterium]